MTQIYYLTIWAVRRPTIKASAGLHSFGRLSPVSRVHLRSLAPGPFLHHSHLCFCHLSSCSASYSSASLVGPLWLHWVVWGKQLLSSSLTITSAKSLLPRKGISSQVLRIRTLTCLSVGGIILSIPTTQQLFLPSSLTGPQLYSHGHSSPVQSGWLRESRPHTQLHCSNGSWLVL